MVGPLVKTMNSPWGTDSLPDNVGPSHVEWENNTLVAVMITIVVWPNIEHQQAQKHLNCF